MKKFTWYYCFLTIFGIIGLYTVHHVETTMLKNIALRKAEMKAMQPFMEDIRYYDFLETIIPDHLSHFIQPFYEHTKNDKEIGVELLAVAWNESRWKTFRSPRNKNGTFDYGPLMLNSIHLNSQWFKDIKKEYKDDDIAYMIGGIKIYKDLRTRHNTWDSFRMYNGGENGGLRKRVTLVYAERVTGYCKEYMKLWQTFKKKHYKILNNRSYEKWQKYKTYIVPTQSITKFEILPEVIPYIKRIRIKILSRRLYYMA